MVQLQPHMMIFGWQIADWVGAFTILSAFVSVIVWIVKQVIINPSVSRLENSNALLNNTIHMLSEKVDGIGGNAEIVHKEHEKRISDLEITSARHGEDIKTLFKRNDEGDKK